MVCSSSLCLPKKEKLVRLPKGSKFFYLLGKHSIGFDPYTGRFEILEKFQGKKVYAVAVFLIPAYLRLYRPAYLLKKRVKLPLWAYTSVGLYGEEIFMLPQKE